MKNLLVILALFSPFALNAVASVSCDPGCREVVWHHCYPMDGCSDIVTGCKCPSVQECKVSKSCRVVSVHGHVIEHQIFECGVHQDCRGGGTGRPQQCTTVCDCRFIDESCSLGIDP